MVRWCGGAVVRWCGGAVVRWCGGAVVRWCGGAVVRWCGGAVVRWCGGAVVRWCSGAVVQWCSGYSFGLSTKRLDLIHALKHIYKERETVDSWHTICGTASGQMQLISDGYLAHIDVAVHSTHVRIYRLVTSENLSRSTRNVPYVRRSFVTCHPCMLMTLACS